MTALAKHAINHGAEMSQHTINMEGGGSFTIDMGPEKMLEDRGERVVPAPPAVCFQCVLSTILGIFFFVTSSFFFSGGGSGPGLPLILATVGIFCGICCFGSKSEMTVPLRVMPVAFLSAVVGVMAYEIFLITFGFNTGSKSDQGFFSTLGLCAMASICGTLLFSIYRWQPWWSMLCFENAVLASTLQGLSFQHWMCATSRWFESVSHSLLLALALALPVADGPSPPYGCEDITDFRSQPWSLGHRDRAGILQSKLLAHTPACCLLPTALPVLIYRRASLTYK